ncbi:Rtt106-domain-containing protein [Aspergillus campestris IBT 28561]|uniref:Rtt106-domain-containing protein n=1 Tax=Aspergillus campestris (strain IBT 28561) TaxID=1392248 RepID=A0A2I1D2E9_ASPC2|nr:Rtt106-domain-containing protein [Aspergillus campestris IBT 28561]PKY04049.1 Rtt106-domain-containing protein [Aspergillus campestris IBT 28561]
MAFATINSSAANRRHVPNTVIPSIEDAFAAEPNLKKRVYDAIGATPQYKPLFEDIARYTSSLQARTASAPIVQPVIETAAAATDSPAAKKRKLQNGDVTGTAQSSVDVKSSAPLQFYMQDVSFAIPQRKKLTLEITAGSGILRARNQASKEVEFGIPMHRIQHVVCLPVPEKNQRQFNFCIIPQNGDGINTPPQGELVPECMVFTVNDGPAKAAFTGSGQQIGNGEGETAEKMVRQILDEHLSQTKVVRPDEREFVSAMPEAHRKGEKAYHVKAFRGSKEGYLFLLPTGIMFGFKKPLLFFAFETVDSISYTSVLQRTFNLNVMARPITGDEPLEFEFSMIDQANFSGIDAYIRKHGLQDASLAEARRAKKYNVNPNKADEEAVKTEDGAAEEEESELQKAQRELEDQEDEDEEDYDPGSESDTDGSGSSSDDDDDDEDGQGEEDDDDDEDGDPDLVTNELGSEAEDVKEEQL